MNIRTTYDPKPIPMREFDWVAVDADTYDGFGCLVGWGSTEEEAIADLKMKLEDEVQATCVQFRSMKL